MAITVAITENTLAIPRIADLDFAMLHGRAGKRARLDEDWKRCVAAREKLVKNDVGAGFEVVVKETGSSRRRCEADLMKLHVVACRRSLSCQGVVAFTEDASKNGRPLEVAWLHCLWDARRDIGCVCPPTAIALY